MSGIKGSVILNSMRISNNPTLNLVSTVYLFPMIPRMEMGDVYRIKGLKLSVGTGPENSSILTSKEHDVALEKHSMLLLVPAQWAIAPAPAEAGAAQPISTPTQRTVGRAKSRPISVCAKK